MIKKGLSRLGTLFLYLLSLLPFRVLYLISDILFFFLYYITCYRRKVVKENLANAFPEKSADERDRIEKKYYKYLADLIMETVKLISISESEVRRRMLTTNDDLMKHYFNQGKSIISVSAHYCNWEMAAVRFGLITDKKRIIVYKPLSNSIFDNFFNKTRSRFGSTMIPMRQTLRKMIEYKNELTFSVLASDQTPARDDAKYFTTFLNQPTAVFSGIEKLTKLTDAVVVFYRIDMVKRGFYRSTIVPLVEEPNKAAPFEITETHVKYLESIIREKPEYWLWSHRRWKIKPDDVH
ncbi:MAG TPA: lysophospholipid acyltransferase family protein [Mucilaginibacter sp.]|jgi:KDO2-lipid IV(A) lauroyltransferase|nr:lysophospholipid acyltransferase family protein [Mucilaginibacter sp.]